MTSHLPRDSTSWKLTGQLSCEDRVREFEVDSSPFSIGRRAEMSLTISSPTISNHHAELLIEGERLLVRDCGSTNGTFVNGARMRSSCVIDHGDLVQFAQIVFRASQHEASAPQPTLQNDFSDQALALIQFDRLITDRAVLPHFQPIDDRTTIGYEVLGRSKLYGLSNPQIMFMAAAVLNAESELSRLFRVEGIRSGQLLSNDRLLFVNTHPAEIVDIGLLHSSLRELREISPDRPIVLEIHEATATQTQVMHELRALLNDLDIQLAYDDFGAGQARLVELVDVPPDYLKFDMQLVQGLADASSERRKMVERLVQMTCDLGIKPLAEGIETEADHQVCCQMGFAHAQGFLYGKPVPPRHFLQPLKPVDFCKPG
ncbi:EAL domain-containing protein [Aeoliella sp. ICT_H6.2]|uniref:EAL domain-containing protein n=1 Tax=Aeoliella straminimaris TaxID=2954799 RepID=A0A9X2FB87_9BACT|nr:EAL domain-containing protein [Aeoliella straminimaris]MCO6045339.1 EAL domain-containing protein [Aeoliella straminimaris]